MTLLSEQTVLVEFADCLEEYARRQRELLGCLRQFRAEYLETLLPPAPAVHATHPQQSHWLTAHRPPPPTDDRRLFPPVAAPIRPVVPQAASAPEVEPPPRAWHDDVFGSAVHATKHNYDYFAELDVRLGSLLPPEGAP